MLQSPTVIDNSYSSLKLSKVKKDFRFITYNIIGFKQHNKIHLSNVSLLTKFLSFYELDFICLNVKKQ